MCKRENIPVRVQKLIAAESRGRCLNPDCGATLHRAGDVWLGECAHICGERPRAARFDSSMTSEARNSAANLLALCPTCHTLVDGPSGELSYPPERLRQWKALRQRENSARDVVGIPNIDQIELLRVVEALADGAFVDSSDPIEEPVPQWQKITYNALSPDVAAEIAVGLSQADRVSRLLQHEEQVKRDVTAVVSRAIVTIYLGQCGLGLRGDDLFRAVQHQLCAGVFTDGRLQAALVVESYFFETCDIFERPTP